ncbi:MAG: DUF1553 domain-containing protein [Verrucomicrobia bacterium]|nr:DUF1553 domain-containing protein [Verrucomicrobiota bacterium]
MKRPGTIRNTDLGGLLLFFLIAAPLASRAAVDFEKEIRPLLEERCVECHGPKKNKGDLRLDARVHALKGGQNGPIIAAGKSAESPLLMRITTEDKDERMPPKGPSLSPGEVDLIRRWIDSGANWPESDADRAAQVDGRLQHWAWQPVKRPKEGSCIDDFIEAKLAEKSLRLSPPADARTLTRRLFWSVIGLPATPEDVNAGRTPHEEIERLLASPQFGERWGRHWLDVVRFAESDGFENNAVRPNAWPYRDYVIQAFNEDKPYDRFVREQLAGDAFGMDAATGFLVGGAKDRIGSKDPVLTANQRADELHDMVSVTAASFLGVTLNCARCHDHKFDPIPAKDYYGFVAVFKGVHHGERLWREKSDAPLGESALGDERPAVVAGLNEDRFAPENARFVRFTITNCSTGEACIDELEVFNTNGENIARSATVKVSGTLKGQGFRYNSDFLTDGRYGNDRAWASNIKNGGWVKLEFAHTECVSHVVWSRDRSGSGAPRLMDRLATGYQIEVSEDGQVWRQVSSEAGRSKTAPSGPQVYAGTFQTPGPAHRNHRGDPMQPREEVTPSGLSRIGKPFSLASDSSEQQRRLALAEWIVDPENPLTARVIVNRLWHYYFGTGLVDTPSDLGINGSRPTHPELLDFLASELIEHGWSLKHIHRLILNSKTFQQSSALNAVAARVDSDARLLWRYPTRRLEAESLRDGILAVSGRLDLSMGGPGFDLFEPNPNENYVRIYVTKAEYGAPEFRRMVYQSKPRTVLDDFFGAFDCPDAGQPQPRRTSSTTPLQALNLLNSGFALQQSEFFAERLKQESPGDAQRQVRRAFEWIFQREPTQEEHDAAVALTERHGIPALCRALFNANEFLRLN